MRDALDVRFSAAVLRIALRGRPSFERAYGRIARDGRAPEVAVDALFDVASITKVFVAAVALAAVAGGSLALDAALAGLIPEWRSSAHAPITARMLLAHTGGLKSGADYRTLFGRDVEQFALAEALAAAPGERVIYSDLGFIALGTALARARRSALAFAVESTLATFGARSARFRPAPGLRGTIPATERDAWRGLVHGEVHDEKAYLMNGVAGHAGLFATAADVGRLAEWFLAAHHGRRTPLDAALAREATREAAFDPVLRRGLGWALKTTDDNSCGALMSRAAFGHTGFTGTCVWADPERDLTIVLLTNAVHFGRSDLRDVRAAVCDAVVRAVDA